MKIFPKTAAGLFFIVMFVFLFCQQGNGQAVNISNKPSSADVVWIEHENGRSAIFYDRLDNGQWTGSELITETTHSRLNTPCIVRGKDAGLWAFWSVLTGGKSLLYFCRRIDGVWTAPNLISTEMQFNGGATVIVDGDGSLWLFWVGNNGADDDIYVSTWREEIWTHPVQVNTDNTTPDILPFAGVGESGRPWVGWSGFDGSAYRKYFSQWKGDHWSMQAPLTTESSWYKLIKQRFATNISPPDSARNPQFLYIDIQDDEKRFHSFRLFLNNRK